MRAEQQLSKSGNKRETIFASAAGGLAHSIWLPLPLIGAIIVWALWGPGSIQPVTPPQAFLILAAVTIGTACFARWMRLRFRLDSRISLYLPDPLYTLYFATLVLVGGSSAILLALATPLIASAPDILRRPAVLPSVLRQSLYAGVTTLLAGITYVAGAAPFAVLSTQLHGHLFGAVIASAVMFAGAAGFRMLELRISNGPSAVTWYDYLTSPALRFQLMMLAVGPLLPLAEVLDDIEAEVAWLLFLVPLSAIYYLALVSVRLQERTDQLQETVLKLGQAREREADLTDYAALITSAQEEERRRLSRELHDDTAQTLVALSRGLDALSSSRSEQSISAHDSRFIAELGDLAKRSLDSIRRACQDLRPSVLDDLGLAAALASLAQNTIQRGLECEFLQEGESNQPSTREIEVTVYRIAQEALTNALRHAGATSSTVTLRYDHDLLTLIVGDNGHGFSVTERLPRIRTSAEGDARSGLGLRGMRERAGLIKAQLAVESSPDFGTTITLKVPLTPQPTRSGGPASSVALPSR